MPPLVPNPNEHFTRDVDSDCKKAVPLSLRPKKDEVCSIFTYGTLQPGDTTGMPWAREAIKGMKAQPAHVPRARLYFDGWPCLVFDNASTTAVQGWVLSASSVSTFQEKLKIFDNVCQYRPNNNNNDGGEQQQSLYKRKIADIFLDDADQAIGGVVGPSGIKIKAYVYYRSNCNKSNLIASGKWSDFAETKKWPMLR